MWKSAAALLVLVALIGYAAAGFGDRGYGRTVDRPPEQVRAALDRIDLAGEPGLDGAAIRKAEAPDRITWYVMSGDAVAARMTAALEPIDDGRGTRIRTNVERGDAPEARVPPPLRSEAQATTVFASAIGAALDRLVAPRATATAAAPLTPSASGSAPSNEPPPAPPGAPADATGTAPPPPIATDLKPVIARPPLY